MGNVEKYQHYHNNMTGFKVINIYKNYGWSQIKTGDVRFSKYLGDQKITIANGTTIQFMKVKIKS